MPRAIDIQGKLRWPPQVLVGSSLHNWPWPSKQHTIEQSLQSCWGREGGKTKNRGTDIGKLAKGWEGEKEAGKRERLWGFHEKERGNIWERKMKCLLQVLESPPPVTDI